jgi:hypothetical protein
MMVNKFKQWAQSETGKNVLKNTAYIGGGSLTGVILNRLFGKNDWKYDVASGIAGGLTGYGIKLLGDSDVNQKLSTHVNQYRGKERDQERNEVKGLVKALYDELKAKGWSDSEIREDSKMKELLEKYNGLNKSASGINKIAGSQEDAANFKKNLINTADAGVGIGTGIFGWHAGGWSPFQNYYARRAAQAMGIPVTPGMDLADMHNAASDYIHENIPGPTIANAKRQIQRKYGFNPKNPTKKAEIDYLRKIQQARQDAITKASDNVTKATQTLNNLDAQINPTGSKIKRPKGKDLSSLLDAQAKAKVDLNNAEEVRNKWQKLKTTPNTSKWDKNFKQIRNIDKATGVPVSQTLPQGTAFYKNPGGFFRRWPARVLWALGLSTGSAWATDAVLGGSKARKDARRTRQENNDAWNEIFPGKN